MSSPAQMIEVLMATLKYQIPSPLIIHSRDHTSPHRAGICHFCLLLIKLSDFSPVCEVAKAPLLNASWSLMAGCFGKGHEKMETELDSSCCNNVGLRGISALPRCSDVG